MRIGDAEREAAVEELRRHAAAGRLDAEELEQRVEAALAARTEAELEPLTADLPRAPRRGGGAGGFGEHLRAYLAVNALLIAIWALTGGGYFWPVWPLLGWGVGIVLHGGCSPGRKGAWPSMRRTPRRRRTASSSSF